MGWKVCIPKSYRTRLAYSTFRTPRPIIDAKDWVITALAGRPNDSQWDDVSEGAAEDVRQAGNACSFNDEQSEHRRGQFPALATGVSFGGGQKVSIRQNHYAG